MFSSWLVIIRRNFVVSHVFNRKQVTQLMGTTTKWLSLWIWQVEMGNFITTNCLDSIFLWKTTLFFCPLNAMWLYLRDLSFQLIFLSDSFWHAFHTKIECCTCCMWRYYTIGKTGFGTHAYTIALKGFAVERYTHHQTLHSIEFPANIHQKIFGVNGDLEFLKSWFPIFERRWFNRHFDITVRAIQKKVWSNRTWTSFPFQINSRLKAVNRPLETPATRCC